MSAAAPFPPENINELESVIGESRFIELYGMTETVGIADPERPGSERVAAAILLKPGIEKSDAEKQNIPDYLRENVAPYKMPKAIQFMDELPTSGVGKVLKRELKEMMGK